MFVDRAGLRYGAADSGAAGEHSRAGAEHLGATSPTAGMFGDFPDAHGLHETISQAHQHHSTALDGHCQILDGVAEKASYAETQFGAMDERNAATLRDVRCT